MSAITVHIEAPSVGIQITAPHATVALGAPVMPSPTPPPTPPTPPAPTYEGPYEATPTDADVVLQTAGKLMERNVTAHPLPPYSGETEITPGAYPIYFGGADQRLTGPLCVKAIGLPFADVSAVDAAAEDVRTGKVIVNANGETVVGTDEGGIVIPDGYAYYNGILLPKIPADGTYKYTFIRKNNATGNYDCVQGKSQWRARTQSTLDNWQLEFTNMTTVGTRQYSIPQDGSATSWGEATVSTASYYGTAQDRKVVWASHDIMIASTSNVLYRGSPAIEGGE